MLILSEPSFFFSDVSPASPAVLFRSGRGFLSSEPAASFDGVSAPFSLFGLPPGALSGLEAAGAGAGSAVPRPFLPPPIDSFGSSPAAGGAAVDEGGAPLGAGEGSAADGEGEGAGAGSFLLDLGLEGLFSPVGLLVASFALGWVSGRVEKREEGGLTCLEHRTWLRIETSCLKGEEVEL